MKHFSYIIWDVSPFFELGSWSIRWYTLLFALTLITGSSLVYYFMRREHAPMNEYSGIILSIIIGGFLGARLVQVLYTPQPFMEDPLLFFKVWEGGIASHGGIAGVLLGTYIYSRYIGSIYYWWIWDRLAIAFPLAGWMIRIGNLMNSEVYGKVTDVPWAFQFSLVDQLARHPTQLYEAICTLMLGIVMFAMYQKGLFLKRFGVYTAGGAVVLSLIRFGLEFSKEGDVIAMGMNMGQWLSAPFILLGLVVLGYAWSGKIR